MAAGLSIKKENINKFLHSANAFISSNYTSSAMEKCIKYDTNLAIKEVTKKFFDNLTLLEPFGQSNPRPVFLDSSLQPKFRRIGKMDHIKMHTRQGELIYFNGHPQIDYYNEFIHSIIYTAELNKYNGQQRKQFKVKEIIPSGQIPNENTLFKRYLRTFVANYYQTDDDVCQTKGDNPTLYIAFHGKTFEKYKAKYYDINHYIFNTKEINGSDSLVLSPDKAFPFEYYRKIVMFDTISPNYLRFLQSKSHNVVVKNIDSFDTKVSVESLREDYIFSYNNIGKSYKYKDEEELYNYFVSFGYMKTYKEFLAAFYTFIDVGLIKIANNDILSVDNNKVDLLQSAVFKYLSRE